MRSGMCSSCMRSMPVRGNSVSTSSRVVNDNQIAQKLDTVIAQNAVLAEKVDDIGEVTTAFRESSIEVVEEEMEKDLKEDLEEKKEDSGPVGLSFYLVAAIVVCVVVFLFRDKVLTFITGFKGQKTLPDQLS